MEVATNARIAAARPAVANRRGQGNPRHLTHVIHSIQYETKVPILVHPAVSNWYSKRLQAIPMQENLRIRYQIPALTFRTLDGRDVSAWDFKQKRNRVIALLRAESPASWEFLEELIAHANDWKQKEAVGLVVFQQPPSRSLPAALPPEVIAGTDASGNSIVRFLGEEGLGCQGVFVADRYGELYAKWIVEGDEELPRVSDILKALEQIEIACEECQPTAWALDG